MEQLVNLAVTTLASGINNSVTSLSVASASGFPSTGNFRITIDSEILLVTNVSGTTFTVVRGIEGTAAASHSTGATLAQTLTIAGLTQYMQDMGAFNLADRKPSTAGTYDEEFEGVADTLPSNWAWSTAPSGSDEWKLNSRWPSLLTVEGTGNTSYTVTRSSFNPGAGAFGVWAKVYNGPAESSEKQNLRMYIFNSGLTEGRCLEFRANGTAFPQVRGLKTVSSVESTAWTTAKDLSPDVTCLYMGLFRTSGNDWAAAYSTNGISWQRFGTTESHSFTVDKIRLQFGTTILQSLSGIDWLRYRTDNLFPRP